MYCVCLLGIGACVFCWHLLCLTSTTLGGADASSNDHLSCSCLQIREIPGVRLLPS